VTNQFEPPTLRMYAELPSGEHVVPGAHPRCPGPDAYGGCPVDDLPHGRPCAGATWHYHDGAEYSWQFEFARDPSMCPVAVLRPRSAIDVPLD